MADSFGDHARLCACGGDRTQRRNRLRNLLAARAKAGALTSLPLRSFDMEAQYELAFRTLQGGLNTGKIVVRVASRRTGELKGSHIVTGGTGGLGMSSRTFSRSACATRALKL